METYTAETAPLDQKQLDEQGITRGLERLNKSRDDGDLPATQQLLERQMNERLEAYGDSLIYAGQVMIAEAEGEAEAS